LEIFDFYWSNRIITKIICKHNIRPEEVEELFRNKNLILRKGKLNQAFGVTNNGRYLIVIFINRINGIEIVTARQMTKTERRYFRNVKKITRL